MGFETHPAYHYLEDNQGELMSRIVIGDVHGCFDTLMELMKQFPKDVPVSFVGDLIDRGPKSKQVVDFVKAGGYDCVKGNHEIMMMDEGPFPRYSSIWGGNGGDATVHSYFMSYGPDTRKTYDDNRDKVEVDMKDHMDWFETLPLFIEYPDCTNTLGRKLVISHSFIGNVWRWDEERRKNQANHFEEHIVWGRPSKLKDNPDIYNIHGHTPQPLTPRIRSFYANVDTGAFCRGQGHGFLSAIQYPEMTVYRQRNVDVYDTWIFDDWKDATYEEDWTVKEERGYD